VLLCLGLGALVAAVANELGGPAASLARIAEDTPAALLTPVPLDALVPLLGWLGLFCAGALGNLPGQDLAQRIFSARSANIARWACLCAGGAYLLIGCAPIFLGLAANLLLPDETESAILPALAGLFLEPWLAVVFVVTILSAVLSTIDSAILAPAAVIARNLVPAGLRDDDSSLRVEYAAVLGVAVVSLGVALLGADAYSLLEGAYEIGLVSLLVPLVCGLAGRRGDERSALAAMGVGTTLWLIHIVAGWEWIADPWLAEAGVRLPVGITSAVVAALAYGLAAWNPRRNAAA
jgi:Na+/proline symporter